MGIAATAPVGILGTGSYLPEHLVGNEEVGAEVGVDAAWIERKTGISTRRRAAPDQACSDLAARAGRAALAAAGVAPEDLRYVVVATSTPDQPQPATACFVQREIGAGHAAAFDLNAVCSGFVFAMAAVTRLVAADGGGPALVIGADVYSRILNRADRKTAILFGDGAGAVVLGRVPTGQGVLDLRLHSDGDGRELIRVRAGGSRLPSSPETLRDGAHYFEMDGRSVRDYVAAHVPPMLRGLLADNGIGPEEVDHFVPHQANGVMLAGLAGDLGLADRTCLTVDRYGNTGAGSVPISLDELCRSGAVRAGDRVLLAAFGGGMSMGAALLSWV